MKKNWHGLVKILEIQHIRNNKVIWKQENLFNTLHVGAELFMLSCCFDNDGSLPPSNYYFGLDNRSTISVDDLISNLVSEPTTNGYSRQPVSSNGGFEVELINGVYQAGGQIVTFSATGGSGWGPVSNLFLVTTSDNSGILLASNELSNTITLNSGDSITMRMSLALQDSSE